MVNKKISIDLDGVLFNFVSGVIRVTRNHSDLKSLPLNYEPKDWDFSDAFSTKEFSKVFEAIRNTKNFWQSLSAYGANMEALQNFWNLHSDYDFYFTTSRDETKGLSVLEQTTKSLLKHGIWPMKLRCSVIPVKSGKFKADVMRALGIDYSIDDYAPTVEACNRDVAKHQAFLLDRPCNRESIYKDLPRVKTMAEFLKKVAGEDKPKKKKSKKSEKPKVNFTSYDAAISTVLNAGVEAFIKKLDEEKPIPKAFSKKIQFFKYNSQPAPQLPMEIDWSGGPGHVKNLKDIPVTDEAPANTYSTYIMDPKYLLPAPDEPMPPTEVVYYDPEMLKALKEKL